MSSLLFQTKQNIIDYIKRFMVRRKRPKLNSDIPFSWHPFHWKWTLILCFIPRGPEYFFKLTIYASEQICTHRLFSKLWVKLINGFFFLLNVAHTSKTHVHLRNKVKEKARSLHRYEQGTNCLLVLMGQLRDQSKYKAKIHLWLSLPPHFLFFVRCRSLTVFCHSWTHAAQTPPAQGTGTAVMSVTSDDFQHSFVFKRLSKAFTLTLYIHTVLVTIALPKPKTMT